MYVDQGLPSGPSGYAEYPAPPPAEDRFTNLLRPRPPTITERIGAAIFSPVGATVGAVMAVPALIGAAYWAFVVNGPTPVVRARTEDEY